MAYYDNLIPEFYDNNDTSLLQDIMMNCFVARNETIVFGNFLPHYEINDFNVDFLPFHYQNPSRTNRIFNPADYGGFQSDATAQEIADNQLLNKQEVEKPHESMDIVALALSQMDIKPGSGKTECIICLNDNTPEKECVKTHCNHEFHFKCLSASLKCSSKCPFPACEKELIS